MQHRHSVRRKLILALLLVALPAFAGKVIKRQVAVVPDPTGSCCSGTSTCAITTEAACVDAANRWTQDGTCPDNCNSCCTLGSCTYEKIPGGCGGLGVSFPGLTCDNTDCEIGACCTNDPDACQVGVVGQNCAGTIDAGNSCPNSCGACCDAGENNCNYEAADEGCSDFNAGQTCADVSECVTAVPVPSDVTGYFSFENCTAGTCGQTTQTYTAGANEFPVGATLVPQAGNFSTVSSSSPVSGSWSMLINTQTSTDNYFLGASTLVNTDEFCIFYSSGGWSANPSAFQVPWAFNDPTTTGTELRTLSTGFRLYHLNTFLGSYTSLTHTSPYNVATTFGLSSAERGMWIDGVDVWAENNSSLLSAGTNSGLHIGEVRTGAAGKTHRLDNFAISSDRRRCQGNGAQTFYNCIVTQGNHAGGDALWSCLGELP